MKQEYKTEEYVVAFIDVLGATKKITTDQDTSLNVVHKAYNQAIEVQQKLFDDGPSALVKPKVKIFSDNIMIAAKTKTAGLVRAFFSTVILSALVQSQFLISGYLVRGGVTVGNCFVDDTMVWGKALVQAHMLESSIAIYPRIIIDPGIIEKLGIAKPDHHEEWLQEDKDGIFFIDYIQPAMLKNKADYLPVLFMFSDKCDNLIEEAKDDLKVLQKINWHISYLAEKVKAHGSNGSDGVDDA